jgi:ATP-dependent helicase/DNAse subunit B
MAAEFFVGPPPTLADISEVTDAEEDEEEVLEDPDQSIDVQNKRVVEVAVDMCVSLLETAKEGIMTSNVKATKRWAKHFLMALTNLVYAQADDKSIVRGCIMEQWRSKYQELADVASRSERESRMFQEMAEFLHHNGWEQEALKFDRKVLRRQSRSVKAQRYASCWDKLVQMIKQKG